MDLHLYNPCNTAVSETHPYEIECRSPFLSSWEASDERFCVSCSVTLDTTFSNGCLGSCNDEERSEMRYVMRIAEPSESSNL
jgi:hypothetical protein